MGIDVTVDIEIAAAPATVFAYLANPKNDAEWIGGITTSKQLTSQPVGIGTQVQRTAGFMGRSMDYVTEITAFDHGQLLNMKTLSGPFEMIVTYSVEPLNNGCRVRLRNQGGPTGAMALFNPLMAIMVRKNTNKDLQRLKAILQS